MNCETCESPAEYGVDFGYGGRMNLCRECMLTQGELHPIADIGAPVEKRPTDPPVISDAGFDFMQLVAAFGWFAALFTILGAVAFFTHPAYVIAIVAGYAFGVAIN